ncbi:MAG: hypothetical protein WKF94_14180 [Solirubrobacteraceae bacterium]
MAPSLDSLNRAAGLAARTLRRRRGFGGFVAGAPDPRHAVELFAGEWASRLPPPYEQLPVASR